MLWLEPAATATAFARPPACTGDQRVVVVPSPSSPAPLEPQVHTDPSLVRATEKKIAALIAVTPESPGTGIGFDEGILQLLNRSYQFLAPRYMPVTEWTSQSRPAKHKQDEERRMVW